MIALDLGSRPSSSKTTGHYTQVPTVRPLSSTQTVHMWHHKQLCVPDIRLTYAMPMHAGTLQMCDKLAYAQITEASTCHCSPADSDRDTGDFVSWRPLRLSQRQAWPKRSSYCRRGGASMGLCTGQWAPSSQFIKLKTLECCGSLIKIPQDNHSVI